MYWIKFFGPGKLIGVQVDIEFLGQRNSQLLRSQAYRQHHDIKFFRPGVAGCIDIANQVLAVLTHGLNMRYARFDKANTQIVFSLVIIALKILAEGANVDVKDGRIQPVAAVFFG